MWAWSLNWGQITDNIVIGTCPMSPNDLRRIHGEAGASGVLSLQHDDCLAYWDINFTMMHRTGTELGLMMERCPIRDFNVPDMRRHLPTAIRTLAYLLVHGHRTYIHCTAGMGRAPTVVLGYLTLVEGYSPDGAIRLIQKGRPESVPAWEAYYGCREDLVARHRKAIERRAYELYELGIHDNAHADWFRAQVEILRSMLT
jgi:atypical dual specificity phosphatase